MAAPVDHMWLGRRIELREHADRSDVIQAIGHAKALLFASLRESFGGVILEAAEHGTPIVLAKHFGDMPIRGVIQSTFG